MSDDKVFSEGLFFNLPSEKAPDFIKGSISIDLAKFGPWATRHAKDGKVRISLKVAKSGKAYAELDTWQPKFEAPTRTREKDGYELTSGSQPRVFPLKNDDDSEIPF